MKIYNSKLADFFISEEIFKERISIEDMRDSYAEENIEHIQELSIKDHQKELLENFFSNPEFKTYSDLYARKNNKVKPYAVLDAHGSLVDNEWKFQDKGRDYSINNWIKKREGTYGSFLITCCNEGKTAIPKSKKSVIVFSNGATSFGSDGWNFEIILPGQDRPFNPYCLEYEINNLKSRK